MTFFMLNGEEPPAAIEHSRRIREFEFHPHLPLVAIGDLNAPIVTVYDLTTGTAQKQFELPDDSHGITWSPSGKALALGCFDKRGYIYEYETEKLLHVLSGHANTVANFSFHPDEVRVATQSWDGHTVMWDLRSEEQLARFATASGAYSEDGRYFRTRRGSQLVTVWGFPASRVCREIPFNTPLSQDGPARVALNNIGSLAAIAFEDGVRIWDLQKTRTVAHIQCGYARSMIFHPNGKQLLVSGEQGLQSWELEDVVANRPQRPRQLLAPQSKLMDVALDRTGGKVAVMDDLRKVHILDLDGKRPERVIDRTKHDRMAHLSVSPDGTRVATGAWHGRGVRLFDASTGKLVREFVAKEPNATPQFSPDGRILVTNCVGRIIMWDLHSGEPLWQPVSFVQASGTARQTVFRPDGKVFAYRPSRATIRLARTSDGGEIATLEHPDGQNFSALTFSPDGHQLVCLVANNRTIFIWDLKQLNEQLRSFDLQW